MTVHGNTGDLAKRHYVTWGAPGVVKIPDGEAEDIQAVVDQINKIQRIHQPRNGHCYGGTHARTHGVVKGTFIVPDDLPAHLKQTEIFSQGGSYPVICRYSSEPGDPSLDDRIAQPRGFAMKLFNLHGDFFDAGKDFPTQDIEFNSTPALDLTDAKTTKEIIDLRIKYGSDKMELYRHLEERPDTELQMGRDRAHNTHVEALRQYSQTAYRFGDYVIKYSLVPNTDAQRKFYEETGKESDEQDVLHHWLRDFHKNNDAEYLLQVQLLENLEEQPVEYAGKVWDADKYPWQTVAKLVVPKQDAYIEERKRFSEVHMRVDPFHGLKSLEPLGGSNRLRRVVYPASSAWRRKMNGKLEINVRSIDEIP